MKKGGYFTDYSILGRSPLFRGIPAGDFGVLLEHLKAETRSYKKGDLICHAGEHTNALGLVLTFWPGMSGTVFCWGIAAALILYAAHSFWYFIKARNLGFTAGGTLVIGILCLAFGIFCFSRPYVVLSFLPIALGIMLLVDGIGKMPLAVDALSVYSPYRFWVLISAVLPLILGIVLLVNPFRAAKAAIMFFGISILADGLFELITYIQQRRAEKAEYKDIR